MTRSIPASNEPPWYRQFWPWFLIALPATVVVAGITTLVIANRHADTLVADEYYKDGLAINRQLEKLELAGELGITARITLSDSSVQVTTRGPVTSPELSLFLSHPLQSQLDMRLTLHQIAPGFYSAALPSPVSERWHWVLEDGGEQPWRVDGVVVGTDFDDAGAD